MKKETTPARREPDAATLNQVVRWIVSGATEFEVVEAIAEKWPDEKSKPLIMSAMVYLAKNANASGDAVRGWCFEATREVYRQAIAEKDLGVALRAVKQLHDMGGG